MRIALSLLALLTCTAALAQPSENDKAMADALAVSAGGTFGKAKIVPRLERLALAQVTIDFKQATTKSKTMTEKKFTGFGKANGKSATASVTAYLETTDGELTREDYQEITDDFYRYFQTKLKENGIDTVAWTAITASDFYKEDGKEQKDDDGRDEEKKNGQTWVTTSAFNGNSLYSGGPTAFAFGKIKRASKFCDDLGAPAAFIHTTVDFADILVDVEVKTTGYRSTWTPSYNTVGPVTKAKSKTEVAPFMKVPAGAGLSLFWNEKSQAEIMTVEKDIPAEVNYAVGLTEDPERVAKRSKLFSVSFSKKMESTPVVISTTRSQYKEAAKKALEKFADTFIAKVKVMKS